MSATTKYSVTLFVRADPELGAETSKEAIAQKLIDLDRADVIEEYSVRVWGREFRPTGPLEGTEYHESLLVQLREFERWADRANTSFDRLFRRKAVSSSVTDEAYTAITLPTICLAVYQDDTLVGVYPHRDDTGTHSVEHALETIERNAAQIPSS